MCLHLQISLEVFMNEEQTERYRCNFFVIFAIKSRRSSLLHQLIIDTFQMAGAIISSMRIVDIIDILIVSIAIYNIILFIQRTRAKQIVNGLFFLAVVMFISYLLGLRTVYFLLSSGMRYGLMAIIVIFYPELRRGLEYLGRRKFRFVNLEGDEKKRRKRMIEQLVSAVDYCSEHKIGMLIVLEKEVAVESLTENGTILDAEVSSLLLETIFYEGTALHDAAVVIRKGRIHSAGCVLPLSKNKNMEKTLGTRHRAGLGITEVSDAVSIIVSEETGIISTASEGKLSRFLEIKSVEKLLYDLYITGMEESTSFSLFSSLFGGKQNEQ